MGADLWAFVKFFTDGYQHLMSFTCIQDSEVLRHWKNVRHLFLSCFIQRLVESSVIPADSFPTAVQAFIPPRPRSDFDKLLLLPPRSSISVSQSNRGEKQLSQIGC